MLHPKLGDIIEPWPLNLDGSTVTEIQPKVKSK